MAVYFLRSKHISRSNGSRVTRAAAFRAGERIRHEATSEVFDFSSRRGIPYKEIVLPAELAGRPDMAWTQDRSTRWNAAEHAGLRCNSRLAREWRCKKLYDSPQNRASATDAHQKPLLREGVDSKDPRSRRREQDLER